MPRAALSFLLFTTGCSSVIDAPSLLPRPVEATRPDDVTPPPAPVPVDAALTARIAALLAQATAADAAFTRAVGPVRSSGPAGSEAWIVAQSARSAAEVARAPGLDAVTALDEEIAKATDRGGDLEPLLATRRQVQTLLDRQNERLDALAR